MCARDRKRPAMSKRALRQQAKRMAELQSRPAEPSTARENLDLDLDADVTVRSRGTLHRVSVTVDGEDASGCAVWELQMRVAGVWLKMGGIGGVGTRPEHRFKGQARRVIVNALRWMRRGGYDVTLLFGITGFYPKFGYAPAFPRTRSYLDVDVAAGANALGYRFVPYGPKYLKRVLGSYHRTVSDMTGPVRRLPKRWRPFREGLNWGPRIACRVALDRAGRFAGYYASDDQGATIELVEASLIDVAGAGDVLRAAAADARERGQERVVLNLPEDDPVVRSARPLGVLTEIHCARDGGPLFRLIDVSSTLRKLAPRVGSGFEGMGALSVRTNLDAVGLRWSRGKLKVTDAIPGSPNAKLPQWALGQMIVGYASASSLAAAGVLRAPARAVRAFEEMFPQRPHFYYANDKF